MEYLLPGQASIPAAMLAGLASCHGRPGGECEQNCRLENHFTITVMTTVPHNSTVGKTGKIGKVILQILAAPFRFLPLFKERTLSQRAPLEAEIQPFVLLHTRFRLKLLPLSPPGVVTVMLDN